jgi:4-oxalocrotonate tautomerase
VADDHLVGEQRAGVLRENVIINVVETKRENWSFGNGTAPFAN